jgi:hypothetical protein
LGVVGTISELATLRHWNTTSEGLPWIVLVLAGVATAVVAFRPSRVSVRTATVLGLPLAATGVLGLVVHIVVDMQSAPLDGSVGPTWDTLGLFRQLWLASIGGVGPALPLSAGSLTPRGLALALATYRHPVMGSRG